VERDCPGACKNLTSEHALWHEVLRYAMGLIDSSREPMVTVGVVTLLHGTLTAMFAGLRCWINGS